MSDPTPTTTTTTATPYSLGPTDTTALYNSIGLSYQTFYSSRTGAQALLSRLSTLLPSSCSAHILDCGTGTGVPIASTLAAAAHTITAVDISPIMLDLARSQVPGSLATFVLGDFASPDWNPPMRPPEGYDAVIASYSLGHNEADKQRGFLRRARDWVKPGGWVVVGTELGGQGTEVREWIGGTRIEWAIFGEEVWKSWVEEAGMVWEGVMRNHVKAGENGEEVEMYVLARRAEEGK